MSYIVLNKQDNGFVVFPSNRSSRHSHPGTLHFLFYFLQFFFYLNNVSKAVDSCSRNFTWMRLWPHFEINRLPKRLGASCARTANWACHPCDSVRARNFRSIDKKTYRLLNGIAGWFYHLEGSNDKQHCVLLIKGNFKGEDLSLTRFACSFPQFSGACVKSRLSCSQGRVF